ncbi:uncharacterized mitochondrial protein AtMg00860-like [Argentina anserina]|uniref:uncharacterized mitochondrial protein AtMg00860-like n=1 Tax=Argentina anserina TaxID=57926 RepID=UPI0021767649|nr:uncharacterized mitochondrial protein AtMg00860-like [Potentilla anserina]
MSRLLKRETEAVMVEVSPMGILSTGNDKNNNTLQLEIQTLLEEYAEAIMKSEWLKKTFKRVLLEHTQGTMIYSATLDDHLLHLRLVLEKLKQHTLKVKESKRSFGVQQVEYLGHVISAEGVAVDPEKIQYIKQWDKPKTLKALRGFLGLAGYYRKYVRNFGSISKPLTVMLKKDNFKWSVESTQAFQSLKEALMTTPVLAIPDFSIQFVVECDASDKGIGAVLSQDGHPVSFLSKALAPRHTV